MVRIITYSILAALGRKCHVTHWYCTWAGITEWTGTLFVEKAGQRFLGQCEQSRHISRMTNLDKNLVALLIQSPIQSMTPRKSFPVQESSLCFTACQTKIIWMEQQDSEIISPACKAPHFTSLFTFLIHFSGNEMNISACCFMRLSIVALQR